MWSGSLEEGTRLPWLGLGSPKGAQRGDCDTLLTLSKLCSVLGQGVAYPSVPVMRGR